jgi:hypothetical protein
MLVADGDVAAVLSLVGRRCSRETAMVLLVRSVGTRRPEGGIGNGHDDGALKGECTTRAWSEAYSSELARMGRVFQSASLVRGGSRWDTATEVKGRGREWFGARGEGRAAVSRLRGRVHVLGADGSKEHNKAAGSRRSSRGYVGRGSGGTFGRWMSKGEG